MRKPSTATTWTATGVETAFTRMWRSQVLSMSGSPWWRLLPSLGENLSTSNRQQRGAQAQTPTTHAPWPL